MMIPAAGPVSASSQQNTQDPADTTAEAPPKQVATAMERLSRAARLIADVRIGADRLLEALFLTAESPYQSNKSIQLVLKEESAMRKHFQDLRSLGNFFSLSSYLSSNSFDCGKTIGRLWSFEWIC
ncbi:hypothetical protein IEQ34_006185 [Dendrobium chrysotoxum]|uniref:Uncharacterized protein n=1 Tax=Dendrobium chrysotoxum TaxID=161865 RepID=A0AAV7HDY2_DENCH|nr:hypothetical protein IEQ34_006185 [Dendrobium chrysotoxum]